MRTIMWFTSFVFATLSTLPKLKKAERLKAKGDHAAYDNYIYETAKKWMLGHIKRSGATVEVKGTENIPHDRAVVFISNHQGNFDIPLLMGYVDKPTGFIAKIELKKLPIVRKWMELIHCVFMDRSTLKGSAGAIIEGIKLVKQGHSLVIFPEGTRSKSNHLGEFKEASFKLATKANAPIVPITINGSYKLMEANHNHIKPAHVELIIHPPVETKGLSKEELLALPKQIEATIASGLPNNGQ